MRSNGTKALVHVCLHSIVRQWCNGNGAGLLLDHNRFGDAGAQILATGLTYNFTLAELSLAYCDIGPAGAKGIAKNVLSNARINSLNLKGNRIGADGFLDILQSLRTNLFLEHLSVADNNIAASTKGVVQSICELIRDSASTLRQYDLRHTNLSEADAQEITAAIAERVSKAEAKKSAPAMGDAPESSPVKKKKTSKKKKAPKDATGIKTFRVTEKLTKATFKELYKDGAAKAKKGKGKKKSKK
jgi:hypothetical protein